MRARWRPTRTAPSERPRWARDLATRQPVQVVEENELPLALGKPLDRRADELQELAGFEGLLGGGATPCQISERAVGGAPAAKPHLREVHDDAGEPGPETLGIAKPPQIEVGLQDRLGEDVLDLGPLVEHPGRDQPCAATVPLDQLGERMAVARARRAHEPGVAVALVHPILVANRAGNVTATVAL